MRAAVYREYGLASVISVENVPKPEPKAGEVLVRIVAASLSEGDRRVRSRDVPEGFALPMRLIFGWSKPRKPILGTDFAGVVEAVGGQVTRFKSGDAVVGTTGMGMGCHAEFLAVREDAGITLKPDALSFGQAAAGIFGGLTALTYLRDLMKVQAGERLLIVGAGGAVGTAAVQLARHMGATVIASARTEQRDLLRSLGAERVIDYRSGPILVAGECYDAVLDAAGLFNFKAVKPFLAPNGRLGLAAARLRDYADVLTARFVGAQRVVAGAASEKTEDLATLMALMAAGHIRPVIEQSYSLIEARQAHERLDRRGKTGSILLTM